MTNTWVKHPDINPKTERMTMESTSITWAGLVFREYTDADAKAVTEAALESVATVGRWMPWCNNEFNETQALEWFATCRTGWETGSAFEYGIFCQETGEFLGGTGLNDIRQQHKFCNLGYWIRQSRQRQGIASRCIQALSTHGFHQLGLQRIEIVVALGNHASEGVAIKAGALHEGIARNRLHIHGRSVSAHMFSLVPQQAK